MPSTHKSEMTAALEAMKLQQADGFDFALELEVQTDKEMIKFVACRECQRPLAVTTFFSPAKAICRTCKGEVAAENGHIATVGQPIPGQTDPSKAVNLADCLVNKPFAAALCPVHPDDEEHVMELKHVFHNDNYGPGEWVVTPKGTVWKQIAKGESVRHQCTKCNATVDYSTVSVVQYKRQNEVQSQPDLGPPHRNSLLGVRGPDPTLPQYKDAA